MRLITAFLFSASVTMATLEMPLEGGTKINQHKACSSAWWGCHVFDILGYLFNYCVHLITAADFVWRFAFL